MRTEGATNLWGGMKLGLDLSMDNKCKDKNTFIVVLTDGEPNNHPPDG
jgi:Mg-chelatase subunit ChlD